MYRWQDRYNLSGKEVKSVEGILLGHVRELENEYILTDGEPKFYIPIYLLEKYDGHALWFKIDEDEAKSKFMLATTPIPGPF